MATRSRQLGTSTSNRCSSNTSEGSSSSLSRSSSNTTSSHMGTRWQETSLRAARKKRATATVRNARRSRARSSRSMVSNRRSTVIKKGSNLARMSSSTLIDCANCKKSCSKMAETSLVRKMKKQMNMLMHRSRRRAKWSHLNSNPGMNRYRITIAQLAIYPTKLAIAICRRFSQTR